MICQHYKTEYKPNTAKAKFIICHDCDVRWRLWTTPPGAEIAKGVWYPKDQYGEDWMPPYDIELNRESDHWTHERPPELVEADRIAMAFAMHVFKKWNASPDAIETVKVWKYIRGLAVPEGNLFKRYIPYLPRID